MPKSEPMQMSKAGRSVDVFRVAGGGGDASVDRLADLADDDQIVNCPGPQRTEQLAPRLRQGVGQMAKNVGKLCPSVGTIAIASRLFLVGTAVLGSRRGEIS